MPISSILRTRRQKEKDALKKKILNVAKKIAVKEGWGSVTIRRIASEISYSLPVIYSHFRDKAEIVFLIANEGFEKLTEELNQAIDNDKQDTKTELLNYCNAYYKFGIENPAIYHAMYDSSISDSENGESDQSEKVKNYLVNKLEPKTEKSKSYLELLWANVHGLVSLSHLKKVSSAKVDSEEYLKRLVEAYTPAVNNGNA
jgi:AcrR family transcriptional regulator